MIVLTLVPRPVAEQPLLHVPDETRRPVHRGIVHAPGEHAYGREERRIVPDLAVRQALVVASDQGRARLDQPIAHRGAETGWSNPIRHLEEIERDDELE